MALTLLRLAPVSASARGLAAAAQRSVRRRRAGVPASPPGATPSPVSRASERRLLVSLSGPWGGRPCLPVPSRGQTSGAASFSDLFIPGALGWEAGLQAPSPGRVRGERKRAWQALPAARCRWPH